MKKIIIAFLLLAVFCSNTIATNGCNPNTPNWGESLGTISFATNNTWTVGNQIWSDAVQTTVCSNRTTFNAGSALNADCRRNLGQRGDFFSACAIIRFEDSLCPYPWRVPTKENFLELDLALGGNGDGALIQNVELRDNYLNIWGGTFSGSVFGHQGVNATYWALSKDGVIGRLEYCNVGWIYINTNIRKDLFGYSLRCVKNLTANVRTHVVTNGMDSGAGSLREAIANANNGDTIVFAENVTVDMGAFEFQHPTPPCMYTDKGVEINGVIWATRNVNMPGTFAENPESFGMFFQWNRRIGWNSTDINVTGWDNTAATGDVWEAKNDPCPPGWRIPTTAEYHSLVVNQTLDTVNGVRGWSFSYGNNTVFFPHPDINHRRGADGMPYGTPGRNGNYWGERYRMATCPLRASVSEHPHHRNYGFSVRCVKNLTANVRTHVVTNGMDSGAGSLREAIANANNGDTIIFAENVTTVYFAGVISIDKNITIIGNEANNTTFRRATVWTDNANHRRFFQILTNTEVVFSHLTMRDMVGNCAGGAIENSGKLTLNNCVFSNNQTSGTGGAISNRATLIVNNSVFNNNHTTHNGGAIDHFGALLEIRNSQFIQNSSGNQGGAITNGMTSGGIRSYVVIKNSIFESNTSPLGGAINGSSRGGITIDRSTFRRNNAGWGDGGAILNDGQMDITNSIFYQHRQTTRSVFCNGRNAVTTLTNCLFINNTSANSLFGIIESRGKLTLINNTIANNAGGIAGINVRENTATVYNTILWNNNQQREVRREGSGNFNVFYSLVGTSDIDLSGNNNIIGENPLFVGNDDFSLQENSPGINAGNNAFLPAEITTDLAGNPRISGGVIDMGAFEFQHPVLFDSVAALLDSINRLHQQLLACNNQNAAWQDSVISLNQQLATYRNLNNLLNDSIDELHQQLIVCNNQNNKLSDTISARYSSIAMLLGDIFALQADTARLQDSIGGLHQQLTTCSNQTTALNDSIGSLHQELIVCNNRNNTLNDSIGTLHQIIVEWIKITDELFDTIDWLRQALADCQTGTSNAPIHVENQVHFYPNPVTDQLHIVIPSEARELFANSIVELFDINGRKLITLPLKNQKTTIDLSNLIPGTYILRITQQNGKMSVMRVVKM